MPGQDGGRDHRAGGGLAFGLRDIGDFFVWRRDALEQNLTLFEFVNPKRRELARVRVPSQSGRWCTLKAEIQGERVRCHLDNEMPFNYMASAPARGFVGLWSKADSVTYFCDLTQDPR